MTSLVIIGYYHSDFSFIIFFQVDPANIEGLKSRLEQKDKEICALKQAAKVRVSKKSVIAHITVLDTVAKCKENSFECQITLTEN